LSRLSNCCARLAKPNRKRFHPKVTSLQDGTVLLGLIFAHADDWSFCGTFSKFKKEVDLMRSLVEEGKSVARSAELIQEQLDTKLSPSAAHTSAPATFGGEGNIKARIYDLECTLRQKEEEITRHEVELSEEIKELNSELHAIGILLNANKEQTRHSKRRNKRRIYFP
jgi:hypothetical protein